MLQAGNLGARLAERCEKQAEWHFSYAGQVNQKSGLICFKKKVYTNPVDFLPTFLPVWSPETIMQRLLILLGLVLLVAGFAWPWLSKLPFGRLPGDITIERENFSFYFPITTGLLVSLFLSLLLWWWSRK